MKKLSSLFTLLFLSFFTFAQDQISLSSYDKNSIKSTYLNETRDYWVSLPLNYNDSTKYPVIYVLDAEWRFELINKIVFDQGANKIIQPSIVVGIPHIDWEKKRGVDLTFSQSRIEYDGEAVDSTWYNTENSGGALKFYNYLIKELMVNVGNRYSVNEHQTLIGHSYGGYFGGYILSMDHPYDVLHIYDPSIWFSDGEVTKKFTSYKRSNNVKVYLTYQPIPEFHKSKIEEFIKELKKDDNILLDVQFYKNETHNSLFLDSFYRGIKITNKFDE
ncbi:hypothetical protein KMW28_26275 [Flammeovirga yaeyamensis]|uniref:Alpha/beta hydrolase n=1 Tax=Flammeovirga yaeyamensis TaxID=367791 RepID=A0AAX1N9Z4_9BACT|nr:alpha/beta hydrolase-fold protein [Flammeovirga yaeyamensis]MBB3699190.1 hypothetical protein [Flammeovirga yaeyamensis]NMF35546.1 alpha/beta hydrolase [Flammeovirga yaeyamensis]QWG04404.1 hypothetical protein KMW28_26275 [Flammeovirga yaeyamensis]